LEALVAESDPPDPAKIAEDTRALLQNGEVSINAAIDGLSAMLLELRNAYNMSGKVLEPIEALIAELRSRDQDPPSGRLFRSPF
jgi:hypothetical protein